MFSDSSQFRDWSRLQQARDQADEDPQCYNYPDAYFPEKGGGVVPTDLAWTKKTCGDCPIRAICAEYGTRWERHGIWGGLSASEREQERRRRRLPEPLDDVA